MPSKQTKMNSSCSIALQELRYRGGGDIGHTFPIRFLICQSLVLIKYEVWILTRVFKIVNSILRLNN